MSSETGAWKGEKREACEWLTFVTYLYTVYKLDLIMIWLVKVVLIHQAFYWSWDEPPLIISRPDRLCRVTLASCPRGWWGVHHSSKTTKQASQALSGGAVWVQCSKDTAGSAGKVCISTEVGSIVSEFPQHRAVIGARTVFTEIHGNESYQGSRFHLIIRQHLPVLL